MDKMRVMSKIDNCIKDIPFSMMSQSRAYINHSQTLEKLNIRGGMSPAEIYCNVLDITFSQLKAIHDTNDEKFFADKITDFVNNYH